MEISGCLQPVPQDMQPSGGELGTLISTNKLVGEPNYHNPDSLVWLLGNANEAIVMVEGVKMMALVDTGSQFSALTERFCTEMD